MEYHRHYHCARFRALEVTTERQWQAMGAERQQALVDDLALTRLGSPNNIANGVMFFVSDLAGYVTGQTLSIDGDSHIV